MRRADEVALGRDGKKRANELLCQSARTVGTLFEWMDLDGSGTLDKASCTRPCWSSA